MYFENGDIFTKYKNFMGYKCENDSLVIVPEQAEVVKLMFQKTFTVDFISGKRKINHGERTKYYVEDTYPAIVSKNIFDRVQEEMKRRERIVRNEDGSTEACSLSPTLNEEWLKDELSELICDGIYNEDVVKRKVEKIEVYEGYILVKGYDGLNIQAYLK